MLTECVHINESEDQKRSVSNVLNEASNSQPVPYQPLDITKAKLNEENADHPTLPTATHHFNAIATTNTAATFNFTGCSSIIVNYAQQK